MLSAFRRKLRAYLVAEPFAFLNQLLCVPGQCFLLFNLAVLRRLRSSSLCARTSLEGARTYREQTSTSAHEGISCRRAAVSLSLLLCACSATNAKTCLSSRATYSMRAARDDATSNHLVDALRLDLASLQQLQDSGHHNMISEHVDGELVFRKHIIAQEHKHA
jgi:hypothetical protein